MTSHASAYATAFFVNIPIALVSCVESNYEATRYTIRMQYPTPLRASSIHNRSITFSTGLVARKAPFERPMQLTATRDGRRLYASVARQKNRRLLYLALPARGPKRCRISRPVTRFIFTYSYMYLCISSGRIIADLIADLYRNAGDHFVAKHSHIRIASSPDMCHASVPSW